MRAVNPVQCGAWVACAEADSTHPGVVAPAALENVLDHRRIPSFDIEFFRFEDGEGFPVRQPNCWPEAIAQVENHDQLAEGSKTAGRDDEAIGPKQVTQPQAELMLHLLDIDPVEGFETAGLGQKPVARAAKHCEADDLTAGLTRPG